MISARVRRQQELQYWHQHQQSSAASGRPPPPPTASPPRWHTHCAGCGESSAKSADCPSSITAAGTNHQCGAHDWQASSRRGRLEASAHTNPRAVCRQCRATGVGPEQACRVTCAVPWLFRPPALLCSALLARGLSIRWMMRGALRYYRRELLQAVRAGRHHQGAAGRRRTTHQAILLLLLHCRLLQDGSKCRLATGGEAGPKARGRVWQVQYVGRHTARLEVW